MAKKLLFKCVKSSLSSSDEDVYDDRDFRMVNEVFQPNPLGIVIEDTNDIYGIPPESKLVIVEDLNDNHDLDNSWNLAINDNSKSSKKYDAVSNEKSRKEKNPPQIISSKTYKCHYCAKSFLNQIEFLDHKQDRHNKIPRKPKEDSSLKNEYKCPECRKKHSSRTELFVHRMTHYVSSFTRLKCNKCEKGERSYESLTSHMKLEHGLDGKWFCPVCPGFRTYNHNQEMIKHISLFHLNVNKKSTKYPCKQCNESFYSKALLGRHENKYHLGQVVMEMNFQLFKCDLCDESFDMVTSLRNHMKKEHLNGVFSSERKRSAQIEKSLLGKL